MMMMLEKVRRLLFVRSNALGLVSWVSVNFSRAKSIELKVYRQQLFEAWDRNDFLKEINALQKKFQHATNCHEFLNILKNLYLR